MAYFGTDGIRGRAGEGKLAPEALARMSQAIGAHFGAGKTAVIGRDTRESGPDIEAVLTRGLTQQGVNIIGLGVLPTPATAFAVGELGADFGIMITASHNPWHDNGVKLFGPGGGKISDAEQGALEAKIEAALQGELEDTETVGKVCKNDEVTSAYQDNLIHAFKSSGVQSLAGMSIVADCANGAAYETLPAVLRALGADVTVIGASPDGRNINAECGSTHTDALVAAVKAKGAQVGVALDGDADRLILVDNAGRVVDGDQIIARLGSDAHAAGTLKAGRVVSTVMSNLGLERYLDGLGLTLDRTPVGDRHVAARMKETGANIGGEPSGHLLLTDHGPTGDGSLAALMVLAGLWRSGQESAKYLDVFEPFPQTLVNVRYSGASPLSDASVTEAIARVDDRLGEGGRVLVRASGTEPLIRIMAEGRDADLVSEAVEELRVLIESKAA